MAAFLEGKQSPANVLFKKTLRAQTACAAWPVLFALMGHRQTNPSRNHFIAQIWTRAFFAHWKKESTVIGFNNVKEDHPCKMNAMMALAVLAFVVQTDHMVADREKREQ